MREQMHSMFGSPETRCAGEARDVTARDLGIRRQEKIHEHLAGTLESPDTLQACMGPIACDLLEMLYELKQGITEAFATGPMASERLDNLRPTIELYARLANQAYKLAHLEHRLKESAKGQQR